MLVAEFEMKDMGLMLYYLGLEEAWGNISGERKVYHHIFAEIWNDGFQAHDYSYDHQS